MGGMTSPRITTRIVPASEPAPDLVPDVASITPPGMTAAAALPLTAGTSEHPQPLSMIASAKRITGTTLKRARAKSGGVAEWQADAWDMYDLIGEQRFLANVLAGRGSQARLYVGRLSHSDPLAAPDPVKDDAVQAILDAIGVTSVGRSQVVLRALIGYFVAGETYVVGIPKRLIPNTTEEDRPAAPVTSVPLETTLEDLDWRAMSTIEVTESRDSIKLKLAETDGAELEVDPDDIYLIRSWRPHPARGWEPDSPTRSSLPVLRELVGLTMAISGQTDSRLAGAGLLLVPTSAARAMRVALGLSPDGPEDPFTDALMEAMMTPIEDRSSAAAVVPLVVTVPDESAEKFKLIDFTRPFDAEMRPLRDEAIRRVALGQDAPPELLLGVAGMNHWGAWLVREDVVTTHLEPPLALLCDSLTVEYLRPALRAAGYADADVDEMVVWYDVSHLIVRPNRSEDAQALYDKGELSGAALRREAGFDESDAPPVIGTHTDPAVDLALQLVAQAPSLMQSPGLPAIVEQIRAVQSGREATAAAADEAQATGVPAGTSTAPDQPAAGDGGGGDIPSTSTDPASPPEISAAAIMQAVSDVLERNELVSQ